MKTENDKKQKNGSIEEWTRQNVRRKGEWVKGLELQTTKRQKIG